MTLTPDARLLGAHDIARAALAEITPAQTVGEVVGHTLEDSGALSLRFECRLGGYPGWFWTVTVAVVDDAEPTVLELELLPGDDALLAPDWVPWAERLAEYRAAAAAAELAGEDADDDSDVDELGDDDDDDDDDFDDETLLHAGDLDGVDIDHLDDSEIDADGDDDVDGDDSDSDEEE